MTDLETFKALLNKANIPYKEESTKTTTCIMLEVDKNKILGYSGFVCDWTFKKGKLTVLAIGE